MFVECMTWVKEEQYKKKIKSLLQNNPDSTYKHIPESRSPKAILDSIIKSE